LEDALTDTPEVGIVRKHRTGSGLIRYDFATKPSIGHKAHASYSRPRSRTTSS